MLVDPAVHLPLRDASRPELPAGAIYRISDLELASRLSFFLWSSIPDEELLAAAAAGRARAAGGARARRCGACWRTRRPTRSSTNFAAQWLLLRQLDTVEPVERRRSTATCAKLSGARPSCCSTRSCARTRSVLDLLDADYTFVDERLARHYGIPNVRGSRFRRVALDDGARRGLLGHGSILTVTSAPNRTSPVKRGQWMLENLLGAPVPPPPPGRRDEPRRNGAAGAQRRRRCASGSSGTAPIPSCAACHALMDPIGFALENFDLIGAVAGC